MEKLCTSHDKIEGVYLSNTVTYLSVYMAQDKLIREPDENSGPVIAGREPVVLPEQRKNAVNKVRNALNLE